MLQSVQRMGKEIGRELSRAWEHLSDGWRELLSRSGSALTRYRRETPAEGELVEDDETTPNWGLLLGDVVDDGRNIVVRVELPGLDRDDYDLVIDGSTLYVRGEKRLDRDYVNGDYYVRQCAYGSFQRAIALPCPVDGAHADASYRAGVLTVKLPKAAAAEPRRIAVK